MNRVMAPPPDSGKKTTEDMLREPEDRYLELLDGVMVEKAAPDIPHARAQSLLTMLVGPEYALRRRDGGSGGWWILAELDITLGRHDWVRPDVCGYRKDKHPTLPPARPVPIPPDWVCEVISESNASRDTVQKVKLYHRSGVGHYWLVDPSAKTLTVLRHEPDGYKVALSATVGDTVRAEPFDAVELDVGLLFADGS